MKQSSIIFFILACIFAAASPLFSIVPGTSVDTEKFPGWPTHFMGKPLQKIDLSEKEMRFIKNFPGKMARFTDGKMEIVFKWIVTPTRKMHPSTDCFKGAGYQIKPQPLWIDPNQNKWSCFKAMGDQNLIVKECIFDDKGQSWPDVSAWYWAARLGKTKGPWQMVTMATVG